MRAAEAVGTRRTLAAAAASVRTGERRLRREDEANCGMLVEEVIEDPRSLDTRLGDASHVSDVLASLSLQLAGRLHSADIVRLHRRSNSDLHNHGQDRRTGAPARAAGLVLSSTERQRGGSAESRRTDRTSRYEQGGCLSPSESRRRICSSSIYEAGVHPRATASRTACISNC
jgi:hypothetical protein